MFLLGSSACSRAPSSLAPVSTTRPSMVRLDPSEISLVDREQNADQQVLHVLNRLAFGPRPGDVARVRKVGVDAWIAQQLAPMAIDDERAERFDARFAAMRASPADLMEQFPPPALVRQQLQRRLGADSAPSAADSQRVREMQRATQQLAAQLQASRVARAVLSERQLQEVMTDFWLNHFNVFVGKNPTMRHYLPTYERDVIRPRALGSFRELLGAVAHSPAMLIYLDNAQSMADSSHATLAELRARRPGPPRRRNGLNENYGRELLELHTLGVDGGYTQQDVINVARAFTGWSVEQPRGGGSFLFRPFAHDADPKIVLGHTLPGGRGEEDGEAVLDILATHSATAHFIAWKLVRRLVSDVPPEALVVRAAHAFTRTRGDIAATVTAIVTSPEFFSHATWRAKVKSPFEVVVSAARALGATGDSTPRTALMVAQLGQPLWGHQAPNGWPEAGAEWMNTGAILNRINFGLAVGASRLPGASVLEWAPGRELLRASREQQVNAVIDALLGGEVSIDTRQILLSGDHPFAARAQAQAADTTLMPITDVEPTMTAPTADTMPRVPPGASPPRFGMQPLRRLPALTGLPQVVGLALGAPEFQRR